MAALKVPVVAKKVRDAEAARDALTAALKGVGVVLPSLRIIPLSCTKESPRQLLDLGPCTLAMARTIAAALESSESSVSKAATCHADRRPATG